LALFIICVLENYRIFREQFFKHLFFGIWLTDLVGQRDVSAVDALGRNAFNGSTALTWWFLVLLIF